MKHVILFGGSFDPVHFGHLTMAKKALKQRKADAVFFIPNQQSPFKKKKTDFSHRYQMLKLATAHEPRFFVLDLEGQFEGPSYTIDTVTSLLKQYPKTQFDFLIGDDQIERLHEWKDFSRLDQLLTFIVYGREGKKHPYPVINGDIVKTSSTLIRQGMSCMTDEKVLRYFVENHLYTEEILKTKLSPERLAHTYRVKDLALEIAAVHHLDLNRIKIAALWHDLYRECQNTDTLIPTSLRPVHRAFDHAYLAADTLSRHYFYRDKHVLKAITHHVNGQAHNDIAKVLFIADKCERGRKYDSEPLIELSKKDLNKGFKACKEASEAYLRRNKNE